MATAKTVFGCIRRAAENARERCPTDERARVETFVCYLSGALGTQGPEGKEVADVVFALFKDVKTPTNGA